MIGLGIIGCGAIAGKRYLPVCMDKERVGYAGFWDRHPERTDDYAKACGGVAYASLQELLDDTRIDAVCICLPAKAHKDAAIACLKAGKHVLLEKPMALNPAESNAIVEACRDSDKELMLAYSQRFYSEHIQAKKWLQEGRIGKVISFRTCLSNSGVEYSVYQSAREDFYDTCLERTGGVTFDVGSHRVDLIRFLFDAEIEEVLAATPTLNKRFSNKEWINKEDHSMVILRLGGGIVGTMWVSWCNYGLPDTGTTIFGERGAICIRDRGIVELYTPDGMVERQYRIPTQKEIAGCEVVEAFVDAVRRNAPMPIKAMDGLRCIEVIDAICASGASGEWRRVVSSDGEE